MGLLAETLLEAAAQDNTSTGAEVDRLRQETRAKKRQLAQARRERALKAMNVGMASAAFPSGGSTAEEREKDEVGDVIQLFFGGGGGGEILIFFFHV